MKTLTLITLLLLISPAAQALDITMGIGGCDSSRDWCPPKVHGIFALSQTVYETRRVRVAGVFRHMSKLGDGELDLVTEGQSTGDQGVNTFSIEVTIKLF